MVLCALRGKWEALPVADAIVLAVAHQRFLPLPLRDYLAIAKGKAMLHRRQSQFDANALNGIGFSVWRL